MPTWQHINHHIDCTRPERVGYHELHTMCFRERICTRRIPSLCRLSPLCETPFVFSDPWSSRPRALIHSRWHFVAFVSSTIVLANSIGDGYCAPLGRDIEWPPRHLAEEMFSEQFLQLIRLYMFVMLVWKHRRRVTLPTLWFEAKIYDWSKKIGRHSREVAATSGAIYL